MGPPSEKKAASLQRRDSLKYPEMIIFHRNKLDFQEEDNLSIVNKMDGLNVSFIGNSTVIIIYHAGG